jgi:hypothetical protein
MKRISFIILFLIIIPGLYGEEESEILWVNAENFLRYGQADSADIPGYERLPAFFKDSLRTDLLRLGSHSSGLSIAFITDSPFIRAKWKVRYQTKLPHMPRTSTQGVDLYSVDLLTRKWNYVGTGKWWDENNPVHNAVLMENSVYENRVYVLYLPLYDAVDSVFIGIHPKAKITSATVYDPRDLPILVYGTSITQGGSASRPGMAYPAILSRYLHREILNFGFSGNGRLDLELADYLATIPASLLVVDALPNVSAGDVDTKLITFILRVRESSDIPILIVPNISYGHEDDNSETGSALRQKYEEYLIARAFIKKSGVKNVTFLLEKHIRFSDDDGSVDGVHLTDLGMKRHADSLYPVVRKLLK